MIIEPELKKKTALSRGINARHYSIRNEREISIVIETKEQSLFSIVLFAKKKKAIPMDEIFKQRYSLLFTRKIRDNNTNKIIIKIIN